VRCCLFDWCATLINLPASKASKAPCMRSVMSKKSPQLHQRLLTNADTDLTRLSTIPNALHSVLTRLRLTSSILFLHRPLLHHALVHIPLVIMESPGAFLTRLLALPGYEWDTDSAPFHSSYGMCYFLSTIHNPQSTIHNPLLNMLTCSSRQLAFLWHPDCRCPSYFLSVIVIASSSPGSSTIFNS